MSSKRNSTVIRGMFNSRELPCLPAIGSTRIRAIRAASPKASSVGDSHIFAWSTGPEEATAAGPARPRRQALVWRADYHPDGGQLFFPLHRPSFIVPLALPGDDVRPESFTAFRCDGSSGLYIHPNIRHGAVVPLADHAELRDRQGRVHARVSVDFAKGFGCCLSLPPAPGGRLQPAARPHRKRRNFLNRLHV
jgi:hypothetical protein